MDEFYRREIEVRGHRLLIYFNRMLNLRGVRPVRKGAELKVFLACHNKWGKQFRVRRGGNVYYTFECCAVCGRQKTEAFFYDEIRPLLPAEWWQPI